MKLENTINAALYITNFPKHGKYKTLRDVTSGSPSPNSIFACNQELNFELIFL